MAINIIKTGLFLCSVCVLGFFINGIIHYLCNKKREEKVVICDLPLFFLIGGGAYAFYEMFFSICGIKSNIRHFLFLFIAALAAYCALFTRGFRQSISYKMGKRTLLPAIIIILGIFVPLFISLIITMAFPQFDIDMLSHILMKAKIFTAQTYKSSIFIHDDLFSPIHSRYPPFVGMFFNLLFLFGADTVSCYQIVNYFILLLIGITLYSFLKHRIPLWQCLIWFFIFISTKAYISSQFIIDSTDVLLSLSFLLSIIWFIKFKQKQDMYSLVISALLAGISTLIKNEALVFSAILAFIWLWLNKKSAFKYLLIWSFIAIPWILYRNTLPQTLTDPENFIDLHNIINNMRFLKYASAIVFRIMLQNWNTVFILLVPAMIILFRSKYKHVSGILLSVIAPLVSVYFVMILLHIGKTGFIPQAFFRILSHVYPMAIILIALAAERLMHKQGLKT